MTIFRIIAQVSLILTTAGVVAAPLSEADERAAVRAKAKEAYLAGDFGSLEHQHETYSEFTRERTSSGAFKMTLLFDGIADAKRGSTEDSLLRDIQRTKTWTSENSAAPLAHVLHAAALLEYGGYFRGSGFANTVPPQAWKIYEEYARKAGDYLLQSQAAASKSTSWHVWTLNIARIAGWPSEVVRRIFEAGVAQDPTDYRLYQNTLEYYLPKWSGSAQATDEFIQYAVTRAPSSYGLELYARLYAGAGEGQFKRRLYMDSLVDWAKMKEGLELWYQRFPTTWNKNIVAYHACIAGDKSLAKQTLNEIGDSLELRIWQPNAKATVESCVRWADDPNAAPTAPRKMPAELGERAKGV